MTKPTRRAMVVVLAAALLGACGERGQSADTPSPPNELTKIRVAGQRPLSYTGTTVAPSVMPGQPGLVRDLLTHQGRWPDLPDAAMAYRFEQAQTSTDSARAVATAFGVNGDVTDVPINAGGGWRVGPADGSGPTVFVGASGEWHFTRALGAPSGCLPATTAPPTTIAGPPGNGTMSTVAVPLTIPTPTCTEAPPPSAGEMQSIATKALTTIQPGAWTFDLSAASGGLLRAALSIDGVRSPIQSTFRFSANGLESAQGFFGTAVPAGMYPLVDPDVALQRINDHLGGSMSADVPATVPNETVVTTTIPPPVTTGTGPYMTTTTTAVPISAPAEPASGITPPPIRPLPDSLGVAQQAPASTAVTTTITLPLTENTAVDPRPSGSMNDTLRVLEHPVTEVEVVLMSLSDAARVVWLVPAYEFTTADGMTMNVEAIADEYIEVVEPVGAPVVTPAPPVSVTVPPPPTISAAPRIDRTSLTVPEGLDVIGMTAAEATAKAAEFGFTVRVWRVDQTYNTLTADLRPDRLTLEIDNGHVTAAEPG